MNDLSKKVFASMSGVMSAQDLTFSLTGLVMAEKESNNDAIKKSLQKGIDELIEILMRRARYGGHQ